MLQHSCLPHAEMHSCATQEKAFLSAIPFQYIVLQFFATSVLSQQRVLLSFQEYVTLEASGGHCLRVTVLRGAGENVST